MDIEYEIAEDVFEYLRRKAGAYDMVKITLFIMTLVVAKHLQAYDPDKLADLVCETYEKFDDFIVNSTPQVLH